MPRLFVSYAGADAEVARSAVDSLQEAGFSVDWFQDPAHRGGQFPDKIAEQILTADAFIALLSPHSVASSWCRRERSMAMQREDDLTAEGRPAFLWVGQIAEFDKKDRRNTGFLRSYDWIDLRGGGLDDLVHRLRLVLTPATVSALDGRAIVTDEPISRLHRKAPAFRNRTDELNLILHQLRITGGRDFWLVVAPPHVGKSWFLDRLGATVDQGGDQIVDWTVTQVDARFESVEVLTDSRNLLARLFGRDCPPDADGLALAKEIGIEISRLNQRRLCLLDSAELLDRRVVEKLREYLVAVHEFVQEGQGEHARVAFVAASRRADEWSGVSPRRLPVAPTTGNVSPRRLSPVQLTPFDPYVVTQALRDAAAAAGRRMSNVEFSLNTTTLHRYSEGLPALLARGIEQLQRDGFVGLGGISESPVYDKLVHGYVEDQVLSARALYPAGTMKRREEQDALIAAFRALTPCRILLESHLREDVVDDEVRAAFEAAGWQDHHAWAELRLHAPLVRPQHDAFEAIDPAIRRLLTRHFYPEPSQAAAAHRRAAEFFSGLVRSNQGLEQSLCAVEQLWHEAVRLGIEDRAGMQSALLSYANALASGLKPSIFSGNEVARHIVSRLQADDEFADTVRHFPDLFRKIVDVFENLRREGPS